jgi:small subunit ribosomal protein S20
MPHLPSSKKRLRQNVRRRARNRMILSRLRTARRRFTEAADAGDADRAREAFREAERLFHRAASNGPIHRGFAARNVSRMQRRLNALTGTAGPA